MNITYTSEDIARFVAEAKADITQNNLQLDAVTGTTLHMPGWDLTIGETVITSPSAANEIDTTVYTCELAALLEYCHNCRRMEFAVKNLNSQLL